MKEIIKKVSVSSSRTKLIEDLLSKTVPYQYLVEYNGREQPVKINIKYSMGIIGDLYFVELVMNCHFTSSIRITITGTNWLEITASVRVNDIDRIQCTVLGLLLANLLTNKSRYEKEIDNIRKYVERMELNEIHY